MNYISNNIQQINNKIGNKTTLVAVSKTKPVELILDAYNAGQRVFGENKVQELVEKYEALPKDIQWHMIGHLQTNKVKYITPFVHLIHGVDSEKLLQEINKQAKKCNKVVNCLLQLKVAQEDTKFGMSLIEAEKILAHLEKYPNTNVIGIMGMATNSEDETLVRTEFKNLKNYLTQLNAQKPQLSTLSMGMSSDFEIAVEEGSTMIRVGSSIFGER